jgi:hypothetical protein
MATANTTPTFYAAIRGTNWGDNDFALSWGPFAPQGAVFWQILTAGANNTIAPFAGVVINTMLLIVPPASNSQTYTLKGVAGDTGVPMIGNYATVAPFSVSNPLVINLAAGSNKLFQFIVL